jgi:hypothetical protein
MSSLPTASPVPGPRRARVVALALVVVATGALAAAPAQAQTQAQANASAAAARARAATVCALDASLYETPGGARVGIVHRGDRVRVVAKGARDGWWRVAASFGTRGWIRATAICRRDR